MTTPKRIQLRRTAGWRMPENTAKVARPTIWGNPYKVSKYGLPLCLAMFRNTANGLWQPLEIPELVAADPAIIDDLYESHNAWTRRIKEYGNHPAEIIRVGLGGLDLACFCSLSSECHGTVLLEIANPGLKIEATK